jgi:hypothetical protein
MKEAERARIGGVMTRVGMVLIVLVAGALLVQGVMLAASTPPMKFPVGTAAGSAAEAAASR